MTDQAVDTSGPASAAGTEGPSGAAPRQFFGRERELKELQADIERAGLDTLAGRKAARARVLLIAGRPGSGRTALAEELARALLDTGDYPDGLLRVRLTDPGGAPVPTERTARDLLDQLGVAGAARRRTRTNCPSWSARPSPTAACCCCSTTPPTPNRSTRCCRTTPTAWWSPPPQGPLTGIPDVRPCTLGGLDTGSAVELLGRRHRPGPDHRRPADRREPRRGVRRTARRPGPGRRLARRPPHGVRRRCRQAAARAAGRRRAAHRRPPAGPRLPAGLRVPAAARRAGYCDCSRSPPPGSPTRTPRPRWPAARCSAAQSTLDDFVRLGLLRTNGAELPQYEVPGCLAPLLQALLDDQDRPAEVQLARARMLERTVRLLQSCRAITEPDGFPGPPEARRTAALAALPAPRSGRRLAADPAARAARLRPDRRGRRRAGHPGPAAGGRAGPGAGRAPGHRGRGARAVRAAPTGPGRRRAARAAPRAGRRTAQPRRSGRQDRPYRRRR